VGLVAAGVGLFAVAGTPWHLAERGWRSFENTPVSNGANLNGRLFSIGNNGRVAQWRVAWHQGVDHPIVGTGAATFEHYWNLKRSQGLKVRNVHNLYLEAFATLGVVGLALLLTALAAPATALVRLRRRPFVPFVAGAYAAYLAHALVDWDWQITAVTLPVLILGAALCAGGNELEDRGRTALYVATGLVAVLGLWTIGAQVALAKVSSHASAHRASELQPWSTDPWRVLAEQQLAAGDRAAARATIRTALAMDSRDWVLWYDLARASSGAPRARAVARARALNPLSPELAELRP
jgi:hypothetical protein